MNIAIEFTSKFNDVGHFYLQLQNVLFLYLFIDVACYHEVVGIKGYLFYNIHIYEVFVL